MKEQFAVLDCLKLGKKKVARQLLQTVLSYGLILIIVKTEQSIRGIFQNSSTQLIKCKSFTIYAIIENELVDAGIECLYKMRLWHKPVFHMLIVPKGVEKDISNLCKKETDIDLIEKAIGDKIICYIDPVDDQLEFSGNSLGKKVIYEAFPSI